MFTVDVKQQYNRGNNMDIIVLTFPIHYWKQYLEMKLNGHIKPKGDDEKLFAMKPHLLLKRFSPSAKF